MKTSYRDFKIYYGDSDGDENVTLHNPQSFAVISSRSLCTMWANDPKIEFIRTLSEQEYRMKDFAFVRKSRA